MTIETTPLLRKEFWDCNKRLLKIRPSGKLYYTEEGKREYRALFARYGYALENITTLETFRRTMKDISALQQQESSENLLRAIHDPKTSVVERTLLSEVMGVELQTASPIPAQVVSLSDWKSKKAP